MAGNVILSYTLAEHLENNVFVFPNLDKLDPSIDPKSYTITCLTHQEEPHDYNGWIKSSLYETLRKRLDNKTLADLERELRGNQEKLKKLEFRYSLNPFARGKDTGDKVTTIQYYLPSASIPFYLIAIPLGIPLTIAWTVFGPGIGYLLRRDDKSRFEKNIAGIQEKLKDPRTKIFSNLQETVNTLNVDIVHVKDAHNFMKKVEDFSEFVEPDWEKVNDKLSELYDNFVLSQNLSKG